MIASRGVSLSVFRLSTFAFYPTKAHAYLIKGTKKIAFENFNFICRMRSMPKRGSSVTLQVNHSCVESRI